MGLLNKRQPIEKAYEKEIAAGMVRFKQTQHYWLKISVFIFFAVVVGAWFHFYLLPLTELMSQQCQLWHGVDLTLVMMFLVICVTPLTVVTLIIFTFVLPYKYLLTGNEKVIRDKRYPDYKIFKRYDKNAVFKETVKLTFISIITVVFTVILLFQVISINHFFVNKGLKNIINPLNLLDNSQHLQQYCLRSKAEIDQ